MSSAEELSVLPPAAACVCEADVDVSAGEGIEDGKLVYTSSLPCMQRAPSLPSVTHSILALSMVSQWSRSRCPPACSPSASAIKHSQQLQLQVDRGGGRSVVYTPHYKDGQMSVS